MCYHFEPGTTEIVLSLTEDNAGITNAADVFNRGFGIEVFDFGEEEKETGKTAEYRLTFDV